MMKVFLQGLGVGSIALATWLATKKSKWCWPLFQLGAICRVILYAQTGLYIELALQGYFFYMNYRGWKLWKRNNRVGR